MLTAGYRSLFLSGGGLKTAMFVGALAALDLSSVERFYGVSAGSILAVLLASGASPRKLRELFEGSGWAQLFFESLHLSQLLSCRALLDHRKLCAFLEALLQEAGVPPRCTLGGLRARSGRSFGCFFLDLHGRRLLLYTSESHPHVLLLDAVVASCSLPAIFEPQQLGELACVDCGLFNNAPLSFLPSSREARLCCLVTNVTDFMQGVQNGWRRGASPLTAATLKMVLLTWAELRTARREGVTIFEMPGMPQSMHQFRVDAAGFSVLFRMGRLSVQSRLVVRELGGSLVLTALLLLRTLRAGHERLLRRPGV
jgi:predicted acylesterase/phospholipase RssA